MATFNPTFTPEELQSELWKPVPGFEEFYAASTLGRIKGLQSRAWTKAGSLLRPSLQRNGYLNIVFSVHGKRYYFKLHRVIASAFIGPCPEGQQVNHKDLIKTNCRADNLEYKTPKGNTEHAIANGHWPTGDKSGSRLHPESRPRGENNGRRKHPERYPTGEQHPSIKYPPEIIAQVKAMVASGASFHATSRHFGICRSYIGRLVKGLRRKSLP